MTHYLIATSVLEAIVSGSLADDGRLRIHTPLPLVLAHPVEVVVKGDECHVDVHLDARMGEHLPSLAASVRKTVAAALASMTGLKVVSVDVTFSGVFPAAV
jgi:Asp23 family, cell envelope-related function